MADLSGRKVFKVFNQDFIVDERYNVTKELGQGAYGIVWYAITIIVDENEDTDRRLQCCPEQHNQRRGCDKESYECVQQEDPRKASLTRDQTPPTFSRSPECTWAEFIRLLFRIA